MWVNSVLCQRRAQTETLVFKRKQEMDVCSDDSNLQLVLLSEVSDCGDDGKKQNQSMEDGGIVDSTEIVHTAHPMGVLLCGTLIRG